MCIRDRVGPDGRTFGSITAKKIAEGLQKQFGIKIDKRHIELEHPIRAIGLKMCIRDRSYL